MVDPKQKVWPPSAIFRGTMILALLVALAGWSEPAEHVETFDVDPGWEGINNRSTYYEPREIVQDFGHAPEVEIGEETGAIGGRITPDARPAWYATPVGPLTLDDAFYAAGLAKMEPGGGNLLLGLFNSATLNEWRTPNTLAFRINGRGETMHVHLEYLTSKWRAGAGIIGRYDAEADRMHPVEIPTGGVYPWTFAYDPKGNGGAGEFTATFNGIEARCVLTPEHRGDGATFDHFGLLNVIKHVDDPGRIFLADLSVNGAKIDLSRDPGWVGHGNRATYESVDIRPRFDFGFSATNFAGGAKPGEFGGLFFRGDCREAHRLAAYGAPTEPLTLSKPLRASGRISLRRGVTDSTTLFGFYHGEKSLEVNEAQNEGLPRHFLGFSIEGPSSEGFYAYPSYRAAENSQHADRAQGLPRIYPDGATHEWRLEYTPPVATGGEGTLILTFDDTTATLTVRPEDIAAAQFNRFGFVTPWIDGNGQVVYLDDLWYTEKQ